MIYGKYGEMIFKNMEKNYPIRKQELELTGQLEMKIFEREKVILAKKENIEKQVKIENPVPNTKEILVLAKYQKMIESLVDEKLMKDILEKIEKSHYWLFSY